MKITKKECSDMIKILENRLENNPYDKEAKAMVENLKRKLNMFPKESEREKNKRINWCVLWNGNLF